MSARDTNKQAEERSVLRVSFLKASVRVFLSVYSTLPLLFALRLTSRDRVGGSSLSSSERGRRSGPRNRRSGGSRSRRSRWSWSRGRAGRLGWVSRLRNGRLRDGIADIDRSFECALTLIASNSVLIADATIVRNVVSLRVVRCLRLRLRTECTTDDFVVNVWVSTVSSAISGRAHGGTACHNALTGHAGTGPE